MERTSLDCRQDKIGCSNDALTRARANSHGARRHADVRHRCPPRRLKGYRPRGPGGQRKRQTLAHPRAPPRARARAREQEALFGPERLGVCGSQGQSAGLRQRPTKTGRNGKKGEQGGEDAHVGGDIPRADPVHLDVVLAPLVAERLRQLPERALCGRVRGHGEPALHGLVEEQRIMRRRRGCCC